MSRDYSNYSKDELINHIIEIEKQLKSNKYGLYWDKSIEQEKEVSNCKNNIPVLERIDEKCIINDSESQTHILIEGDNFNALTIMNMQYGNNGFVDLIYIDPPYNTGTRDFMYNDKFVDKEDGFKHSKWLSFMEKRLVLAKSVLKEDGLIFISIDDNEMSGLKQLCDSIFGESKFLTTIGWEKRTKGQNTRTARKMLQPKIEYILVYKNTPNRVEFNCHVVGEREYPEQDDDGVYRLEEIGQMSKSGVRGRGSMIFPILGVVPREGNQWKLGKKTIEEFLSRNDIVKRRRKVYRKIRPYDETSEKIKPFWAFFSAEQFGTAETAKKELGTVLGNKDHGFETVKPIAMIEEIVFQATKEDSVILDFFAGSGSTFEAVLETNKDYGGKRKCILCTNNEGDICSNITFPRLKTVLTGKRKDGSEYSEGVDDNLMYFKTDFINDSKDTDQAKYCLVERIDELLCIVEETYVKKELTNSYSHYENFTGDKHTFIFSDYYNKGLFKEFLELISSVDGEKNIYMFSTDDTYDEKLFTEMKNINVKPVPKKIYEIYKEIVENIKRGE